ncbi:hypothetical protein [Paramagnetospirillum marisnigri]|uniref:hypothetical protein n=1 Tax=Paramagnetospirillum marisnigri TaxID=1285242 RepID=UPI0012E933E3|nr:hypothetical protein [Paramagnetospirillum marisnigri]
MTYTPKVALVVAVALLSGCTAVETTFRQSSLKQVRIDGHDITVSWIRVDNDDVDMVVYEDALWSGTPSPDMPRLNRALARRAAESVMDWRCLGLGYRPVQPSATTGDERYTFRYACGRDDGGRK